MVLKPSEDRADQRHHLFARSCTRRACRPACSTSSTATGPAVGAAMSAHPDIDMMSFTGSTRAGIAGGQGRRRRPSSAWRRSWAASRPTSCSTTPISARPSVRRRQQHDDQLRPVLQRADAHARAARASMDEVERHRQGGRRAGRRSAIRTTPSKASARWSARRSSNKIQRLIQEGIDEGATLVAGGPGRPEGLEPRLLRAADRVRQRDQRHDHRARRDLRAGARDPALRARGRGDRDRQRHDYGLAAYVQSGDDRARPRRWPRSCAPARCTSTARRCDTAAPFGGYKQSGNGREWGEYGFDEFLEIKAVLGYQAA